VRILIGLLIATAAGVGMGYWAGYSSAVRSEKDYRRAMSPPAYFDDFYADPATRPTTRPLAGSSKK
jgi:hypothetical protein